MELHSASRAAYTYFDRIEAASQAQADAIFESESWSGRLGSSCNPPVAAATAPDAPVEFDAAADRQQINRGRALIVGVTHLVAGVVATAMALTMPTIEAGTVVAVAIASCGLAATWSDPF
jgi:hypothetical protein